MFYVKRQTKVPLASKTTCNAVFRHSDNDGTPKKCNMKRVAGDTICKHHSISTTETIKYDRTRSFNKVECNIDFSVRIDYKNWCVYYMCKNEVYVLELVNDNSLLKLSKRYIKIKGRYIQKTCNIDDSKKKTILDRVIVYFPHLVDFFENEVSELLQHVYPKTISDVILSYCHVGEIKKDIMVKTIKKFTSDMQYVYDNESFPHKRKWLFKSYLRSLIRWDEVIIPFPKLMLAMYSCFLYNMMSRNYWETSTENLVFKPFLKRLDKIIYISFKKGYHPTGYIEFDDNYKVKKEELEKFRLFILGDN